MSGLIERLLPPVLRRGWSGPHHLQLLLSRLEAAPPGKLEDVSWEWTKQAISIGMDSEVAEDLRVTALAICRIGLP